MKVLAILTGELCFDGITNSVLNYYKAMDRHDMKIGIVSARATDGEMRRNFEQIGCTVYALENRDRNSGRYFAQLIRIIRQEGYEIVHAHGNSATLAIEMTAALLAGCKVRIVHSRNSFCEHVNVDKTLRPILYATYTDAFACGENAGKWLFGKRPFTVINNGKDIDRFLFNANVRAEYRQKLNAADGQILLGHVGLFHKQKNHPFLINVFAQICCKSDRYRLILIGEGEERPAIEKQVAQLGLQNKVLFLGNQSDVQNWLQALDIMVFPSLFEGMPNVVLEWQIAGLPAIISDTITRECSVTGSVKYLSLEAGPDAWAKVVMDTPVVERDHRQDQIRSLFEKAGFDIAKNAVVLKGIYKDLLRRRKR